MWIHDLIAGIKAIPTKSLTGAGLPVRAAGIGYKSGAAAWYVCGLAQANAVKFNKPLLKSKSQTKIVHNPNAIALNPLCINAYLP